MTGRGERPAAQPRGARAILDRLGAAYGPRGWWPLLGRAGQAGFDAEGYRTGPGGLPASPADRVEVFVGAILTQNTAWRNVALVLAGLNARGLLDAGRLLALPEPELAAAIRSAGYHNQKARKLRAGLERAAAGGWFEADAPPPSRDELLAVWGVGPETADCMALYIWDRPQFVVDAYTRRLLARLGWAVGFDPLRAPYDRVAAWFAAGLAPADTAAYREAHALVVEHAKRRCSAKPACAGCPLAADCALGGQL